MPRYGAQFDAPAVHSGAKTVSFTFDDGPGRSTQQILNILESFHVRATFFNVGQEMVYRPSLVREEARDGFLLGDHTVDHPDLVTLSPSAQGAELDGVIHEYRALVATSPCVFRPPYGAYDATTLALARSRRMAVWQWNVSTDDWEARGSGSAAWTHHIIAVAESEGLGTRHAVLLFHNQPIAMPATVAALPVLIRFFLAHGYTFVDLLGRAGPPGSCGPATAWSRRVPGTAFPSGRALRAKGSLASPSGQFRLVMDPGGDLELRLATGRTLWSSDTPGHPGAVAILERSGELAVKGPGGATLWSSRTGGHDGARLYVRDDGELVIADGGNVLWSSRSRVGQLTAGDRLLVGWRLTSPNGRCRLELLPSGHLTLYGSTRQPIWDAGTSGAGLSVALAKGGDLVVVDGAHATVWQSATGGHGPTRLRLTNTGQLVIATVRGKTLWVTP